MKKILVTLASLVTLAVVGGTQLAPEANAAPVDADQITCSVCMQNGGYCCTVGGRPGCC